MNHLANEKSPYLQHAAGQPIDWYPWGDEAFDAAARQDKPVFLSSGAVWCHWCHVMAKESFEDREAAALLNDNFIAIKLDRDERPDIDRRFQRAAAASGVGGGWPLSVFLTPDKKPFYLGTYFPPDDAYDRPGFKTVLKTIIHLYRTKRQGIDELAEKIMSYLGTGEIPRGAISESLLNEATGLILSQFDSKHGGFQRAPKFPMAGALEFLLQRAAVTEHGVIVSVVKKTLEAMARGGLHDQLAGGFHRYSVDESWCVPHFEKMADDNAWLLKNYTDAYSIFGDEYFRQVAKGIIRFTMQVLADPDGGFYASQDADVIPDRDTPGRAPDSATRVAGAPPGQAPDEGGYFTWTEDEVRDALNDEEYRILSLHFLHRCGAMHHDPSRMVLLISMNTDEIAQRLAIDVEVVDRIVAGGKEKLLARRQTRKQPFVDRTLYTSLNGMFIAAFLKAYRAFKEKEIEDFALRSLSRIRRERLVGDELFHSEGIKGFFEDYTGLIEALIEAYEVTAGKAYIDLARHLMDRAIEKFWDSAADGFFDAEESVLGTRLKTIEDVPHPAANSVAIMLLVRLASILGEDRYREYARKALESFSSLARQYGLHAAYFFASLDAYHHILRLDFESLPGTDLVEAGLTHLKPYTALAYGPGIGRVIPCFGTTCFEPADNPQALKQFLRTRPWLKQNRQGQGTGPL